MDSSRLTSRSVRQARAQDSQKTNQYRFPAAGFLQSPQLKTFSSQTQDHIKTMLTNIKAGGVAKQVAAPIAHQLIQTAQLRRTAHAELDNAFQNHFKTIEEGRKTLKKELLSCKDRRQKSYLEQLLKHSGQYLKQEESLFHAVRQGLDFHRKAQKDLDKMTALATMLEQKGKLSPKNQKELNRLVWSYKENIALMHSYYANLEERLPAHSGLAQMLDGMIINLADMHMTLADIVSLHSEHIAELAPISREARLHQHLLETKAAREAVANIKNNYLGSLKKHHPDLKKIDQKLALHEKQLKALQAGKIPLSSNDIHLLLNMPLHKKAKIDPKVKQKLYAHFDRVDDGKADLPIVFEGLSQQDLLGLYLTHQLEKLNLAGALPKADFLQEQGMVQVLNKGDWAPLDLKIDCQINGKDRFFHSQITPAFALSDNLPNPYEGKGISSSDRLQSDHVVNLAKTSLVNDKGETLFTAHRSGVIDAYHITPKNITKLSISQLEEMAQKLLVDSGAVDERAENIASLIIANPKFASQMADLMRQEASKIMARDLATNLLLDDKALLDRALKGEVVDMTLTSLSLMTPDYLRGALGKESEKEMLGYHQRGLSAIAPFVGPTTLMVRNPQTKQLTPVRVNIRANVMNFGVNGGALRGFMAMKTNSIALWRRLMGWELVAPMNDQKLSAMVGGRSETAISGDAERKINQLKDRQASLRRAKTQKTVSVSHIGQIDIEIAQLDKQISKLTQLSEQVKQIWRNRSFLDQGRDPYKMVARIILLSQALGEKPLFHCKSGKDRTGQLDSEAKYLSAVFDETGRLPQPNQAPTDESRKLRTLFALKSGNLDMQKYNTGLSGFKLKNLPALNAQMKAADLSSYQGASAFVAA